jgi:hypothetical protein
MKAEDAALKVKSEKRKVQRKTSKNGTATTKQSPKEDPVSEIPDK